MPYIQTLSNFLVLKSTLTEYFSYAL